MSLEMKYFVIKPKAKDPYDMWARASQDALIAYSERIRTTDFLLADQLLVWATKEKISQDYSLKTNKQIQPMDEAELYRKHRDELKYMAKGLRSLTKSEGENYEI